MKKRVALWMFLVLSVLGVANASAIKVWGAEVLRYVDLNSNFAHIHNTMVGGHGARLVDSDVAATAAISAAKLANPILYPKAVAFITASCTASPCSFTGFGVSTITRGGAGTYVVNWSTTRADVNYGVHITTFNAPASRMFCMGASTHTTSAQQIECFTETTGALQDGWFMVALYDDA